MRDHSKTFVGLDVHKKTVTAAVLPPSAERPTETVTIENHRGAIKRLARRIAARGVVEFVYEAGPCGYEVRRQLEELGYRCAVIAPSLTPVRPGDRVKTDKRDAEKLARLHRAGELTEIRVPTCEEEAARDLVRTREDALADRLRARHRISKFLLRQGRTHHGTKRWGHTHMEWLRAQRFEWPAMQASYEAYLRSVDEAQARIEALDRQVEGLAGSSAYRGAVRSLRALKGVETLTAITLLVEAQDLRRFATAREFMAYTGLVPSEHSSGESIRRGGVTKVGNAHIRRVLIEAAWHYRHRNVTGPALTERRRQCPPEALQIARKAQSRLHRKYRRMQSRGKQVQKVVSAVARELAGFVWSIGQHAPIITTT